MSRHILIKQTKIKHKEKMLKAAREKQQITYKGILKRLIADLSAETLQARMCGRIYSKWWKKERKKERKKKNYNQDYFTHQGSHSDLTKKYKALEISKS